MCLRGVFRKLVVVIVWLLYYWIRVWKAWDLAPELNADEHHPLMWWSCGLCVCVRRVWPYWPYSSFLPPSLVLCPQINQPPPSASITLTRVTCLIHQTNQTKCFIQEFDFSLSLSLPHSFHTKKSTLSIIILLKFNCYFCFYKSISLSCMHSNRSRNKI